MRRLVLAAELSLDGLLMDPVAHADLLPEYDDELVRYQRRVVQKAGVHTREADWTVEAIADLTAEGGEEELPPVVAEGGPHFCRELVRRGLVDEYRLTVHTVALGKGDRLFTTVVKLLNLSTRHFAQGAIAYALVPEGRYRDHPPPYPWSTRPQGEAQHDDDAETENASERPAEG